MKENLICYEYFNLLLPMYHKYFHGVLNFILNFGTEKCKGMDTDHSLKFLMNAYFCHKIMLGDMSYV